MKALDAILTNKILGFIKYKIIKCKNKEQRMEKFLANKHIEWIYISIKKYLFCHFFHRKYKCYPQGPTYWHCMKCSPCGKGIDDILQFYENERKNATNKFN